MKMKQEIVNRIENCLLSESHLCLCFFFRGFIKATENKLMKMQLKNNIVMHQRIDKMNLKYTSGSSNRGMYNFNVYFLKQWFWERYTPENFFPKF